LSNHEDTNIKEWQSIIGLVVFCYLILFLIIKISQKKTSETTTNIVTNQIERNISSDYFYTFSKSKDLNPFSYDTIQLDSTLLKNLINDRKKETGSSTNKLRDSLIEKSYKFNQNLCIWNEEDVNDAIYQYNKHGRISYKLINGILPKTERRNQLVINKSTKEKDGWFQVFRKIEKIYSINELADHLQLIVLGYDEIYPKIQLITLEKESLKYVDKVDFYSLVQDQEGNIVRTKGCLNNEFNTLVIKEIHSTFTELHDTIEYSFDILKSGQIQLAE